MISLTGLLVKRLSISNEAITADVGKFANLRSFKKFLQSGLMYALLISDWW